MFSSRLSSRFEIAVFRTLLLCFNEDENRVLIKGERLACFDVWGNQSAKQNDADR